MEYRYGPYGQKGLPIRAMISHQINHRLLLDYNKTIIRGGRVDKMQEVTRQNAGGYPTKCSRLPDKMQEVEKVDTTHLKQANTSSEANQMQSFRKPKYGQKNPFIKGPIDLEWMQMACQKGAAELALFIRYKTGILGTNAAINIRPKECSKFGLGERKRQRQLDSLVESGLIKADRGPGRCPVVRVIEIPES